MTTASQLYSLQEFDLALDQIHLRKARAEAELETGITSGPLQQSLKAERESLEAVRQQHRDQQQEGESHRERSAELDRLLYAGEVTNPRDLESVEREANNLRKLLQDHETRLLELSLRAEEHRHRCQELEEQITEQQSRWENRSVQLADQVAELTAQEEQLEAQRRELAATFEPVAVQKYEVLRKAKSGTAVAKVLRGLCQGCQMSLPTQQQQQVRSGRRTVHCSSCGRMLCTG